MSLESILNKLQSADEDRKKRWVIVSSVIVMVIVTFLWLKYFNSLTVPAGEASPPPVEGGGFSFFETMRNGLAVIYQTASDKLRGLGEVLKAPRSYIVKPPNR